MSLKAVLSAEFRTFVFNQFRPLSIAHVRFVGFLHGMRMRADASVISSIRRDTQRVRVRVLLRDAANNGTRTEPKLERSRRTCGE